MTSVHERTESEAQTLNSDLFGAVSTGLGLALFIAAMGIVVTLAVVHAANAWLSGWGL